MVPAPVSRRQSDGVKEFFHLFDNKLSILASLEQEVTEQTEAMVLRFLCFLLFKKTAAERPRFPGTVPEKA
jgi:hypothetical protein